MKRITNVVRTLLVAMGLFSGAQVAGAAETVDATVKMTYVDYNNPDDKMGEIAAGETAKSGFNKISGGSVGFANAGWGVNYITYIQVDASSVEGTIIKATLTADCSGSTDSKRTTQWGVGYNASEWSADLTYNTADKAITTVGKTEWTSTKSSLEFNNLSFDITDALANDEDKTVTLIVYETEAAGGYIKNPKVTVEYVSAESSGTCTIDFVDAETNTKIKESITYTGEVGTYYTVTDADKASCMFEDVKYLYVEDNAATTPITADNNAVVTVKFRKAGTFAYTLKNNFGEVIKSGTDWEGNTVYVNYPRYVLKDGTLYSVVRNSSGGYFQRALVLTKDGVEETITYTADKDNVVFWSEAEQIESLTTSTAANSGIRCSDGLCAYSSADGAVITTLPAGKYKLYTSVWGPSGVNFVFKYNGTELETTHVKVNDDDKVETGIFMTTGSIQDYDSKEFVLATEGTITLDATAASRGIDFVYIQKIGDVVSVNEYATFSSTSAIDFSAAEDLTIYTAKLNDTKDVVSLTEVADKKVPANTGVILKGTGEFTGVVTTGVADFESNDLIANTEATTVTRADNVYVLNNVEGIGFYPFVGTLTVGRAHLVIDGGNARTIKIAFGGDTTGITDVENTAAGESKVWHTLSGVRVQNPTKGLYIVNGKKVVVK